MKRILVALGAVGLVCATVQSQETAPGSTAERQSDVEAVRAVLQQYDDAADSGDVDGLVALYDEDGIDMPPDEPAVVGKDAIRARLERFFADYTDALRDTVEDVTVSGDWASIRCSYTESWTPRAGGDTTTVVGKSVIILKRHADGSWRITTVIWNSDAPTS